MSMDSENKEYGITHYIQLNGTKPSGGYFEYQDSKITKGCLTIDDYKVTIENGEMKSAEKGACIDMSLTSCSNATDPNLFTVYSGKVAAYLGPTGSDIKVKVPCYDKDGEKITSIIGGTFGGTQLKELIIPNTVTDIGDGALSNVTNIEKVIVGKSVEKVYGSALSGTYGTIMFTGDNVLLKDGALNADIDKLILNDFYGPFYVFFHNVKSIKTIYNKAGKILDWNQLLTGFPSGEKFASGTVTKGIQEVTIIADNVESNVSRSVVYNDNNGIKYYDSKWIGQNPVYFDPTGNDINCSATHYNKSGKIGCMKWYAYSENSNGTVNMILDHNTTSKLAWVTSADYDSGNGIPSSVSTLGITYPNNAIVGSDDYGSYGNWNKGPITLLKQLMIDTNPSGQENATNRWTNSLIKTDDYLEYERTNGFKIDYSGYKARLITVQEIANLTKNISKGNNWSEQTSSIGFYIDIDAMWLIDNLSSSSTDENPSGYWTSSPSATGYGFARPMACQGEIINYAINISNLFGLRPVITVPKSVIFGS